MTDRQLRNAKVEGTDLKKIQQGCEYIFQYLDENGFSLLETKYLISSMDLIAKDITKNDPLRKIDEFDYSSSLSSAFSRIVTSNMES